MKPAELDITTLKELFERVIRLEEKLDTMANTNRATVKSFFKFAVVVVILELLNVLIHFFF